MKKIALLFTILCIGALNGMESPKQHNNLTEQAILNAKLIKACHEGIADEVIVLINEGAEVNHISKYGYHNESSLTIAVARGYLKVFQALLIHGANPNIMPFRFGNVTSLLRYAQHELQTNRDWISLTDSPISDR